MGLDGGTIPTRGELVQVKKKPEQKDKSADIQHKWSNCTITQTPLDVPIVVCHLGMLFNKKSVLEMLLGKSGAAKCRQLQHIESLKDVKELKLTNNRSRDDSSASYMCPVTGLEMNGKHKFVCLWQCGCVLSERAIKEVPSTQCHECGKDYTDTDLIIINPNDEEFEILKQRMEHRIAARKTSAMHIDAEDERNIGGREEDPVCNQTSTSSVCVHVKRQHNDDISDFDIDPAKGHKSKKHKSDHKHKKSKNKKEKKHKHKTECSSTEKPQIHPGWASILAKRR